MRATRQRGHQQFHCGNPPPAALPSRRTCTPARGGAHGEPRRTGNLLGGRVGGHFHRHGNDGELRLRPFHTTLLREVHRPAIDVSRNRQYLGLRRMGHYRSRPRPIATDTVFWVDRREMLSVRPRTPAFSAFTGRYCRSQPPAADPRARNQRQRHKSTARLQGSRRSCRAYGTRAVPPQM